MQEVIKKGVKTKVLLLSATPVNNKMNDIKNQIAFITEEDDTALLNEGVDSINIALKMHKLHLIDGRSYRVKKEQQRTF